MGREPSPERLAVAAHELGHALVWSSGGLTIRNIKLSSGFFTDISGGRVGVRFYDSNEAHLRAYLIGLCAGFEAEDRWRRQHGPGRASRGPSSNDFDAFRRERRRVGLSESAARSKARSILSGQWGRLERLVPRLARDGRLSL
ncbi:hypothetical protein [Amycolatopsis suaedae]|uniref:Uncharacterized protein n=1 Tax=Amycolatopsis suaedae TaxID=2510978 RepID=A0A4V2ELA3_9PSEU|nr:hypothetical protein [Amycolatopsis suaedae]RZQ60865.1 hypothetical protein EWH70_27590 [Amycolatopsis suaedae]